MNQIFTKIFLRLVVLTVVSLHVICNGHADVNYAQDIAPILRGHCVECHRPGSAAPMSLRSYEDVRPWARSMKKKVVAREMPPWFADPGGLTFRNENRLSDEEIDIIVDWVDSGARPGDLSAIEDVATTTDAGWRLGEPDRIVRMEEAFALGDNDSDVLTFIAIDGGFETDQWVRAVEVRPGNPSVVHHAVVNAGTVVPGPGERPRHRGPTTMLGVYAVGSPPIEAPEGFGKRVRAGSSITLSMHYHKEAGPGTATADRTEVGLYFTDDTVKSLTTAWVVNRELDIAPGEADYETRASFTFLDDGHLYSFLPHMHYRGKDFRYQARYPDASIETLLSVSNYDFNWQLWYFLDEPKSIPKGTVIEVVAHHDNSPENPRNPDPSRRVRWGGASTDEMMIGYFDFTYVNAPHKQDVFPR